MKFGYSAVNMKENIKYAAEPQSPVLNHGSRKNRTSYFDLLAEHNKLELSHMSKSFLEGKMEHQ